MSKFSENQDFKFSNGTSKNTSYKAPPPQGNLLPIMQKIKASYQLWYEYYQILPKNHRYTIGQKIDNLFTDAIEAVSIATFLSREEKSPYVKLAIRKINTLNIFLLILWENKSLDNKKYIALSEKINEIGKMLGGWFGQLTKSLDNTRDKQNSPAKAGEK